MPGANDGLHNAQLPSAVQHPDVGGGRCGGCLARGYKDHRVGIPIEERTRQRGAIAAHHTHRKNKGRLYSATHGQFAAVNLQGGVGRAGVVVAEGYHADAAIAVTTHSPGVGAIIGLAIDACTLYSA